MSSTTAPGTPQTSTAPTIQNYVVRVPKNQNRKFGVMRFNASVGVEFTKWTQVKMERENNLVQYKGIEEDSPKFGAGSEYGREQREEARRKKFGVISKKYRPEDQPWIIQCGGRNGKKFRGVREGGVAENTSYYVFTQAADGAFEAFPIEEWYHFQTVQRYKALSAEEAEEEFSRRNQTLNLFSVMVRKRMKNEEVDEEEDEEKSKKKKGSKGELRISEMDDWTDSSGEGSSNEDENEDGEEKKKKKAKGKKGAAAKKKRKNASDDEAIEESDDGDEEGREVDYMSSTSEESDIDADEKAKNEMKGVAEEDALRKLLNSDEEEDEEENEEEMKDKDEEAEDGADREEESTPSKDDKDDKKKKKEKKKKKDKKPRKEDYGSSSDSDSDSSASEVDKTKPSPKMKSNSNDSSRSATPTKPVAAAEAAADTKRKLPVDSPPPVSKKPRLDPSAGSSSASSSSSSSINEGVNEEAVRRYLTRKPMTTTELLQKFKSKRTGLSSDQLVHVIAQILKRINPVKQTIKGKMYLSIKAKE